MDLYDGTTNPKHHLSNFKSRMYLADASDATRCKAFPTTIAKAAMKWFDSLPPRSVTSFDDLSRKFLMQFSIQNDKVKHAPSLLEVKQEVGEPLRDYMERKICHIERLPPPGPIKNKGGSRGDYYEYHKLYSHSKNDCYDLKNVIEKLAREGQLDRYLMKRSDHHGKRKQDDEDRRDPPPQTPERHIHMISGGFDGGGLTKSSRKRHLKEVYQVVGKAPDLPTISFTKEDRQGIIPGHDDVVVITMILANTDLHRTLVDQGSSADILFKLAFDKLGLDEKELRAYPDTVYGLGDTPIKSLGFIPLHTTFEKWVRSKTLSIDFIVVDVGSADDMLVKTKDFSLITHKSTRRSGREQIWEWRWEQGDILPLCPVDIPTLHHIKA
ncbi:uncharacterized protein [Arachis hypogaea]|uniref:uncharacterized protein n=1 Tax=Arachis hypogaea TaxID=3818 RepID=UPI003B2267B0